MSSVRILMIDDEQDFLDVMKQRIKTWGYEVETVNSGLIGIEKVSKKECDIVIVDYMMPEIDGLTTVRKIREINPQIPVIMFTAHPDQRALRSTEELNIIAFIPKYSAYTDTHTALKSALALGEKKI